MKVAYPHYFTPGLRPGGVDRGARRVDHAQAVEQIRRATEGEAESRRRKHRCAVARNGVRQRAGVHGDGDRIPSVWRGEPDRRLRRER